MQKKEIEKIPPLKRPKADARTYSTVAAVEIVDIKEKTHLIVDVFRAKKPYDRLVRIAVTRDEWANLMPDGSWNGKQVHTREHWYIWETDRDLRGRKQYFPEAAVKKINAFAKKIFKEDMSESYKSVPIEKIYYMERGLAAEKEKKIEKRRYERTRLRNDGIGEAPEEFVSWAKNQISKTFLYYKRASKTATVTCSECGKTYTIRNKPRTESYEDSLETIEPIPKSGYASLCKFCGRLGQYKQRGKCENNTYRIINTEYLIEPYNETGIVVRTFEISKTLRVGEGAEYTLCEYGRLFIDKWHVQKDWLHRCWGKNGYHYEWRDRNICSMNPMKAEKGKIWPGSNMQGTILQYSEILTYQKWAENIDVYNFCEQYIRFPELEILIKLGMKKLVKAILERYGVSILHKGKNIPEKLKISPKHTKLLIRNQGDYDLLQIMQLDLKHNFKLTDDELLIYKGYYLQLDRQQMNTVLSVMSMRQYLNRCLKYAGINEDECKQWKQKMKNTMIMYADYLHIREERHHDIDNSIHQHPRDLAAAHTAMVIEQNKEQDEKYLEERERMYPLIRKRYRSIRNRYYYDNEDIFIRPAKSATEIVLEGRQQHHCVGGDDYLGKHNDGKSYILLMRYKDSPEVPYITIEIKENKIVQWYGEHDKKPDEILNEVRLKEYLNYLKEKEKKIAV